MQYDPKFATSPIFIDDKDYEFSVDPELIKNLDRKIHNQITQYGSKVGVALKFFKEKGPMVNEKIDQDSTRIDKIEDIYYQPWVCLFFREKHSS